MPYANPESLVATDWLAERLSEPGIKVIDASWYLPAMNRDAKAEYRAGHIPGAVPFDLETVSDKASSLPHMFPDADAFVRAVGALGIGRSDHVVVYDGIGFFSAPRVWYTFRLFGHPRISVLDGGLPKWKREGRPLEAGEPAPRPVDYSARANTTLVRDKGQMLANLGTRHEQVLDARPAARFTGEEPDLWPGRRRGHIPGAYNLPYAALVDPQSGTFLPADALRQRFVEAGLDLDRPVVTSCGSGVTAAILAFGLHLIGQERVALYDGSWAEWGLPGDAPVETGPAAARSNA
jgi:thiosulfate/3-mercaptopyruvate sulfurtransferase